MEQSAAVEWFHELKSEVPRFLDSLQGEKNKGFYRYSLTGDLNRSEEWGLGNSVFAAKNYYMLNALTSELKKNISEFILQFQDPTGYIFDPYIAHQSRLRRVVFSFRSRNFNNLFNEQTKRAETRQSFAALRCVDSRPDVPYMQIPYTKELIREYIYKLKWATPWEAGSHLSHLAFFLMNNYRMFDVHSEDINELVDYAFEVVNEFRQTDGAWYDASQAVPKTEKVNGAMKLITALSAAEKTDLDNVNALIDLCLSTLNEGHACNHFNIIYVLSNCHKKSEYRAEEIQQYCLERLDMYKEYYWSEYGGFSFFKRKANSIYYNAKISSGKQEPDIHGTSLLLWGIVLISDVLQMRKKIGFNFPYT
ncbi:MAG: hypothetical protein HQM14_19275 [SAR324 cluster bacterium]|nr:hypothetical protein [SAR324 cluster bacterium]